MEKFEENEDGLRSERSPVRGCLQLRDHHGQSVVTLFFSQSCMFNEKELGGFFFFFINGYDIQGINLESFACQRQISPKEDNKDISEFLFASILSVFLFSVWSILPQATRRSLRRWRS